MIMGLGTALFEELDFDDGQVANANLSDYNLPAPGDLPAGFTHELIESRGRRGARAGGDGRCRRSPPRSATRWPRSASTSASCR